MVLEHLSLYCSRASQVGKVLVALNAKGVANSGVLRMPSESTNRAAKLASETNYHAAFGSIRTAIIAAATTRTLIRKKDRTIRHAARHAVMGIAVITVNPEVNCIVPPYA